MYLQKEGLKTSNLLRMACIGDKKESYKEEKSRLYTFYNIRVAALVFLLKS